MIGNELFTADVLEYYREIYNRTLWDVKTIDIDGEKYYVMPIHPYQHYRFKVMIARESYKHARWVERYNRWLASRGEPPYQEIEPEVGTFEGVNVCHRH